MSRENNNAVASVRTGLPQGLETMKDPQRSSGVQVVKLCHKFRSDSRLQWEQRARADHARVRITSWSSHKPVR
eukprot:gene148-biopygen86